MRYRIKNKIIRAISHRLDRLVIRIFSFIWKHRLNPQGEIEFYKENHWLMCPYQYRVVKVKGLRSALIDTRTGQRIGVTFLFHILGKYV